MRIVVLAIGAVGAGYLIGYEAASGSVLARIFLPFGMLVYGIGCWLVMHSGRDRLPDDWETFIGMDYGNHPPDDR